MRGTLLTDMKFNLKPFVFKTLNPLAQSPFRKLRKTGYSLILQAVIKQRIKQK